MRKEDSFEGVGHSADDIEPLIGSPLLFPIGAALLSIGLDIQWFREVPTWRPSR